MLLWNLNVDTKKKTVIFCALAIPVKVLMLHNSFKSYSIIQTSPYNGTYAINSTLVFQIAKKFITHVSLFSNVF
jgi:hypothetical protein